MKYDCIILGAGLSGLYAALRLRQRGIHTLVLEARDRIGGRILSEPPRNAGANSAHFDFGPAWIWPEFQPLIAGLLEELGVAIFAQPVNGTALFEDPSKPKPLRIDGESSNAHSYRIEGGAARLVDALYARLNAETVRLQQRVETIARESDGIRVETIDPHGHTELHHARWVITALPPRLLARSVSFDPSLPQEILDAFVATPTWMAAHAKFMAFYDTPFWQHSGLSGEAFSRLGPLAEIYDASPAHGGPHALFGFYGLPAPTRRALGQEALAASSLEQLQRLFGAEAAAPLNWMIKDWSEDPLTATEDDATSHGGGHPDFDLPESMRTQWGSRLIFSGSETATMSGGYLEGALEAANVACTLLDQNRK